MNREGRGKKKDSKKGFGTHHKKAKYYGHIGGLRSKKGYAIIDEDDKVIIYKSKTNDEKIIVHKGEIDD